MKIGFAQLSAQESAIALAYSMTIYLAETDDQIQRCFAVMVQLRPHLMDGEFVERVQRQRRMGYQLAFLEDDGQVVGVAGFRVSENLSSGQFLYVDDLVTDAQQRSKGYGDRLMTWLVEYAKAQGCKQFFLDSGVQRFDAHRFYFRQRLSITAYHFGRSL